MVKKSGCEEQLFKLGVEGERPTTVWKGDTVEFCSDTLDITIDGCTKRRVCIEDDESDLRCEFTVREELNLQPGDVVTVGKDIHKTICEEWEWATAIKNDNSGNVGPALAVDGCGNIYVAGYGSVGDTPKFYNADLDGNTSSTLSLTGVSRASQQIFVGKLTPIGQWVWTVHVDSAGNPDELPQLAVDKTGNVYVAGQSANIGQPQFYDKNDALNVTGIAISTVKDIFVGKLNPDGFWEWVVGVTSIGISDDDSPEENDIDTINPTIATDNCGNIFVVGESKFISIGSRAYFHDADANGDTKQDSSLTGVYDTSPILVAKLKPTGKWEWVAGISAQDRLNRIIDHFPSVVADSCGNIYVAAHGDSTIVPKFHDVNPTTGNTSPNFRISGRSNSSASTSAFQIFVGKLKPNGFWEWATAVDSLSNTAVERDARLAVDCCGNVFVAGRCGQAIPRFYDANSDGNTVGGENDYSISGRSGSGGAQVFVAKLKPLGKWEWVGIIDSVVPDLLPDVATDCCGNAYVVGRTATTSNQSFYSAGINGNTQTTETLTGRTSDSGHIFLGKISATGRWLWSKSIDSTDQELSPAVTVDNCGNIYVAGSGADDDSPKFYGSDTNGNTSTTDVIQGISGNGNNQIFIGKIANEGRTAPLLGVVKEIDGGQAVVKFDGVITIDNLPEPLNPGCPYYLDSYGPDCLGLTPDPCNTEACNCPNRCLGVAISPDTIIWKPEDPLCCECKCCCCFDFSDILLSDG